jgi:hypothetical protein
MDKFPKLPDPPVEPEPVPELKKSDVFVVEKGDAPEPEKKAPKPKKAASAKQLEHLERMRAKQAEIRKSKMVEKMPETQQVDATALPPTPQPSPTPRPAPPAPAVPAQAPVPPQYIYMQSPTPDMANYVKREDMDNIVKSALAQQHEKIMAEATRIRQEQAVKREAENKKAKEQAMVSNLIRPNVKKNKFY